MLTSGRRQRIRFMRMITKSNESMETEKINAELQDISGFCSCYYNKDNGNELSERLTNLNTYLMRSAVLQTEAQFIYDKSLANETEKLMGHEELSATTIKNLVAGRTATEKKLLLFCERLNRTIVHQIDSIRSQLSYLKSFND